MLLRGRAITPMIATARNGSPRPTLREVAGLDLGPSQRAGIDHGRVLPKAIGRLSADFRRTGKPSSIKPLVARIERRNCNVHDLELADEPVTASRFDEDRHHGLRRNSLAVELDDSLAFEHEVDLSHLPVIVRP